ncbi:hypothetical protein DFJ74DRAFT_397320 [Hyaloraphidium curvatum]|nr:hypothetical protein DFJ74DRAFT_397320 [Hyaloraphidium curvatum]
MTDPTSRAAAHGPGAPAVHGPGAAGSGAEKPTVVAAGQRFEQGLGHGTGAGGPVLESDKMTGAAATGPAGTQIQGGESGIEKPIVTGGTQTVRETRPEPAPVPAPVVQDQTVLAWDQGTRGFATGLVQPVSTARIPTIPEGNALKPSVKASELDNAPGFPNREVNVTAKEFRAVPDTVAARQSSINEGPSSVEAVEREGRQRGTGTASSLGPESSIKDVQKAGVPPAVTSERERERLDAKQGSGVGPGPEPVAPGVSTGSAKPEVAHPGPVIGPASSRAKPEAAVPPVTRSSEQGAGSREIDELSTTSVKSGHLASGSSVAEAPTTAAANATTSTAPAAGEWQPKPIISDFETRPDLKSMGSSGPAA